MLDLPAGAESAPTDRLNAAVGLTVALLAAFMALAQLKDDNIVQAMQQAQADRVDHWGFYQARNLRQEIAESTVAQLEATGQGDGATARRYRELAADMDAKKQRLRAQAEDAERRYATLARRDDQFDLCDGLLAVALAMLAVTALVRQWTLFAAAMLPSALGVGMGLAGLAGWDWRPEVLARLLTWLA